MTEANHLSPADRVALACDAAAAAGLDVGDAEVIRERSATLVRLPAAGALARVERPGEAALAYRQVACARFWLTHGGPALQLMPGTSVAEHPAGSVTLWRWLEDDGGPVAPAALGAALRRLHDASAGQALDGLPTLDPAGEATRSLRRARGHVPRSLWQPLADEVASWPSPLKAAGPVALVHSDPHGDNVVVTRAGPVFVDLGGGRRGARRLGSGGPVGAGAPVRPRGLAHAVARLWRGRGGRRPAGQAGAPV